MRTAATKVNGESLKAGDRVAVRYLEHDGKKVATSIRVEPPAVASDRDADGARRRSTPRARARAPAPPSCTLRGGQEWSVDPGVRQTRSDRRRSLSPSSASACGCCFAAVFSRGAGLGLRRPRRLRTAPARRGARRAGLALGAVQRRAAADPVRALSRLPARRGRGPRGRRPPSQPGIVPLRRFCCGARSSVFGGAFWRALLLALWPGQIFFSGVVAQENWDLLPVVALACSGRALPARPVGPRPSDRRGPASSRSTARSGRRCSSAPAAGGRRGGSSAARR